MLPQKNCFVLILNGSTEAFTRKHDWAIAQVQKHFPPFVQTYLIKAYSIWCASPKHVDGINSNHNQSLALNFSSNTILTTCLLRTCLPKNVIFPETFRRWVVRNLLPTPLRPCGTWTRGKLNTLEEGMTPRVIGWVRARTGPLCLGFGRAEVGDAFLTTMLGSGCRISYLLPLFTPDTHFESAKVLCFT